MFESLGFENLTPSQAAIWFGLIIGTIFGALAQVTRFCFRSAILGGRRNEAAGVWIMALMTATIGTQTAVYLEIISFTDHRFFSPDLPYVAIILGGALFGIGMMLARGCASRLTVLTGSGNLRAFTVLVIFAIVSHATLKGVLAPLRVSISQATISLPDFAWMPILWTSFLVFSGSLIVWKSGARLKNLALAALLGLLVPIAWVGTGFVLFDEFDPIAMESLSFTSPASEALFWTIASTSISPGFGVALLGGVVVGAALLSKLRGEFKWESFDSNRQMARYFAGAIFMGFGGVLAGGCTVGAGLAGTPTLSIAAILALGAITVGGLAAHYLINGTSRGYAAHSTKPPLQPAE
jgi:uncharacterized protein